MNYCRKSLLFRCICKEQKKGILDADEEIKKSGASLIDYLEKEYHLQMSKPRFPCVVATNHFLDNTS